MQKLYLVLADLMLVCHCVVVLFIVGGLFVVWLGHFRHWPFVRNLWFRLLHLAAISFVTVQAVLGEICPLTAWENQLRTLGGSEPHYSETFIGHWLQKLLFYSAPQWLFVVCYSLFLGLVLVTWIRVKPVRQAKSQHANDTMSPAPISNGPRPPSASSSK